MKKTHALFAALLLAYAASCTAYRAGIGAQFNGENAGSGEDAAPSIPIRITAGNKAFAVKLYGNDSARAFLARLPLSISMDELNGNEKYFFMNGSLPSNPSRPGSVKSGDIMLYGSNCLVLFYKSFQTSYSYTKLGSIEDAAGLEAALGSGSVRVTWELDQ